MLKTFTSEADKPDIALELPTGTGKTLTGLLVAEWTRRKRGRVPGGGGVSVLTSAGPVVTGPACRGGLGWAIA
jgi:superfamily II DNA or RNA helicase